MQNNRNNISWLLTQRFKQCCTVWFRIRSFEWKGSANLCWMCSYIDEPLSLGMKQIVLKISGRPARCIPVSKLHMPKKMLTALAVGSWLEFFQYGMDLFYLETYNRLVWCRRACHNRCVSTDETIDFIIVAHVIAQYWSYLSYIQIYLSMIYYIWIPGPIRTFISFNHCTCIQLNSYRYVNNMLLLIKTQNTSHHNNLQASWSSDWRRRCLVTW